MNEGLWLMIMFVGMVVNGLWYYIKHIVHENGYETHLFWGHWQDILNLQQLIAKEQDANKKIQFKTLLFSFYAILFVMFVGFFIICVFNRF